MSLAEKIRKDWIDARKARQEIPANLLGVLIGTIQTKSKNFTPERDLSEAEILKEVQSLLNGVIESKKLLSSENPALIKLKEEERILSFYIPSQMTMEELETVIKSKVAEGKDLKTIMTELKTEHAGKYDGKTAADIIKASFVK